MAYKARLAEIIKCLLDLQNANDSCGFGLFFHDLYHNKIIKQC